MKKRVITITVERVRRIFVRHARDVCHSERERGIPIAEATGHRATPTGDPSLTLGMTTEEGEES